MAGLKFTQESLRAAYNFLRLCPPFSRWKMPLGEEIEFKIIRSTKVYGLHLYSGDKHTISISSHTIGHSDNLLRVMAHEMVHAHLVRVDPRVIHGAKFKQCAKLVCKYHGFDAKGF